MIVAFAMPRTIYQEYGPATKPTVQNGQSKACRPRRPAARSSCPSCRARRGRMRREGKNGWGVLLVKGGWLRSADFGRFVGERCHEDEQKHDDRDVIFRAWSVVVATGQERHGKIVAVAPPGGDTRCRCAVLGEHAAMSQLQFRSHTQVRLRFAQRCSA